MTKKKELLRRYIIFAIGLFINSLGVSFITKASLGTSPISSIPYVLSLGFKPTLGQFTFVFNMLLILLQAIILKKNFKKQYLLQIPVTFFFSYFIDMTMNLLSFLNPVVYWMKAVSLVIGCCILGFGVFLEVFANVVMLPGEAFVNAIHVTYNKDFGKTKVIFDSSMTLAAAVISFIIFKRLEGVREGTIFAALVVGMIARFFSRHLGFLKDVLFAENSSKEEEQITETNGLVITIAREYGSCGHAIGKKLAKDLGLQFYDKEIIEMTAKENNVNAEYIEANEQKISGSLLNDFISQYYNFSDEGAPLDKLYEEEKSVILKAAQKGNCVIVGRCAEHILKNSKNCYRIFLHADTESKVKEIMSRENMDYDTAKKHMVAINKSRFLHCKYYTGRIFGLAGNYDISINTSIKGIDGTVDFIKSFINK